MNSYVRIDVSGLPETKGSWRGLGKGRMKSDNPREKAWADAVGWNAKLMMRGKLPLVGGALVTLDFILPPPVGKKHQRDLDKLARSCLDAMSGIVYTDDELVRELVSHKEISANRIVGGVEIHVFPSVGVRAFDLVQMWFTNTQPSQLEPSHIGTPPRERRAQLDEAHRLRAAEIAALQSCHCRVPVIKYNTPSGHYIGCPAHLIWESRQRAEAIG